MATTKTIQTLTRAKDNFQGIRDKLEEKSGGSLENVDVEDYPELIDELFKDVTVSGKTLIFSN